MSTAAPAFTAGDYFSLLYGDDAPGYIVVWTLRDRRAHWIPATQTDVAGAKVSELDGDVYAGMALQDQAAALAEARELERRRAESEKRDPRKITDENVRGFSKTAVGIPGLWYEVDIDDGAAAHKKKRLPKTLDEALALVNEFPLQPTLIIASGHGIHAHWLFRETLVFESDSEREDAQDASWRFQETLHAKARAHGWDVDSICDFARILRPPATVNHKSEPVAVRVLDLDPSRRYSLEEIEPYLLDVTGERSQSRAFISLPSDLPDVDIDQLDFQRKVNLPSWIRELIKLGHEVDRSTGEVRELSSRSEALWKVICNLVEGGADDATIASICTNTKYQISAKPLEQRNPASWLAPQIAKARNEAKAKQPTSQQAHRAAEHSNGTGRTSSREEGAMDAGVDDAEALGAESTPSNGQRPRIDVIAALRAAGDPDATIREVLQSPQTLGALALSADYDPGNYQAMLIMLRDAGVPDRAVRALERAVNQSRRNQKRFRVVKQDEAREPTLVNSVLNDPPTPAAAVLPDGWRLSMSGIARERSQGDENGGSVTTSEPVAPAPVLITGRLKDVVEGTEATRLAYWRDGRWQHHTAERVTIANARALVDLAGVGLPVTSVNAGDLVRYLADFEAANMPCLPHAQVSRQMGWQGPAGSLGFLAGRTLIRPNGEQDAALSIDDVAPQDWREDWVSFRGADSGDEQLADGFAASGSFDEWRQAAQTIVDYPRVLLAIYASLTPPLLPIFDAPNFVVDWSFATSTGKSTTLRLGASCWGNPDERAPASAMGTWDATRVWVERASAVLNNLPLILDDTKRAKTPKVVAQTIYDVASGKGKGRGSPRGMRRAGNWCTVLLSSGEAPITGFTEDGGARTRVLSIWGLPFERADGVTAHLVHALGLAVRQHHGHAGPELVRFILKRRDEWPAWRDEYFKVQASYLERAKGDPVGGRFAAYFAALDLTAALAHAALNLPWSYRDPVDALWQDLVAEAGEADRALAALAYVVSWANGHQSDFWGRHARDRDGEPRQPNSGWAGRWDRDDGEYLGFLPHRLRAILSEAGFESDPIQRLWRDRGWLMLDKNGNNLQVRVADGKPRVVAITHEAIGLVERGNA